MICGNGKNKAFEDNSSRTLETFGEDAFMQIRSIPLLCGCGWSQ